MSTTSQSGTLSDSLTVIFAGSSYDSKNATISLLPIRMGELQAYNTELFQNQETLRRPRLKSHRAEAASDRLTRSRLVSAMTPTGTLVLRMGKTHQDQRVNASLTYLTSSFSRTHQEALVLMHFGQGPTWYHVPPDGKAPVRLTADSPLLSALPCPEPEARSPLGVARLLATLNHRFFARPGDDSLFAEPPPGSENPIHLAV
ncbi:hypothetical protein ACIGG5_04910 [Streptomyces sp. NPDC085463]|uniref:hypothetical protein n=1 Tax=unclassified Streptomyces TaxID=2593676 RepID=UPI0036E9A04F